jgi:GntR family transcriptional regulator
MVTNLANPLTIDRNLPVPLYSQLKEILLAMIQSEALRVGDALPSEYELGHKFRVSRITVRRAIDELAREGLLVSRQGKGTFVAPPKIERPMTRMKSFSAATAAEGHRPGSRLLALRHDKVASHIAAALGVAKEQWVWVVERLRLVDDQPLGISEVYLNLPPDLYLTPTELEQEGSLWFILEKKGLVLARSEETIQAVSASDKQAELLHIKIGAPLLLIEGIVYSDQATPIEYHRTFNRGDRYKYSVQLTR